MTELLQTSSPPRSHDAQYSALVLAIVIFAGLSIAAAVSSVGFLEADGCTHYLYARFALRGSPHFLVNVWGRPFFTLIYAIPAGFGGLPAARMTSLFFAIACALITWQIARRQQYRWPVLALIFTLGQPLVFLHSFSELTELPFATLLGLAFLFYQMRRWSWMAMISALLPLSRPEGFAFLFLSGAALLIHRKWWWLFVLPLGVLLWNHIGWTLFGSTGPWWKWLIDCWPYSSQSLYPRGKFLHFIALMPAVASPLVFPAMVVGIWRSLSRPDDSDSHRRHGQILIALLPILVLLAHSILYWSGRLASSGEIRYMLIVAPFWALLSARGWVWAFERMHWKSPLRWAGAAVLAAGLANLAYPVLPLRATDDWQQSQKFVSWYKESGISGAFPRVCAAQMNIYFLLDLSPTDPRRAMEYRRDLLRSPTPGTLVVWDSIYSCYNADQNRSVAVDELLKFGWIELENAPKIGQWRMFHSPSR